MIFLLVQEELVKILLPSVLADLVADLVTKEILAELEMQVVIVHLKEITVQHLAAEIMADLAVAELELLEHPQLQGLVVAADRAVTEQQIQ